MRVWGWALVLLAVGAAGGRNDAQCDSHCPVYPTEQAMRRFREIVESSYSGQEEAVTVIRKALQENMLSYGEAKTSEARGKMSPLLLHFTGPTGVGKTLLTALIKDALFISDCGVKKVHLDIGYRLTDNTERIQKIDNMKKAVVHQLERCPRSLVIFDDFQWAPVEMILALKEAFDESYQTMTWRDKTVRTTEAIFIFCSDLESEQRHLSVDMTMKQAQKKVAELAGFQWNMVDQASAFGKLFVSAGLIPFVPLSASELTKVIDMEVRKLGPRVDRYLSFHADNSSVTHDWIGEVRWNNKLLAPAILRLLGEDLHEYNARAVRNLIERQLLGHSTEISKCLLRLSSRTRMRGWIWGGYVTLLDDIKITDVDPAQSFTVDIDGKPCINKGQLVLTTRQGHRASEEL